MTEEKDLDNGINDQNDDDSDDKVTVSPEDETRARATGWTPKEEFKGNPERWTDAAEWNDRADTLLPILKANNRNLVAELGTTKTELTALRKTLNQIVKANDKVSEREYKRAYDTIIKGQAAAIQDQDSATWESLERDKQILEKPAKTDPIPETDTNFADNERIFYQRNSGWYEIDPAMTQFAKAEGNRLHSQGVPRADQFQEIERMVRVKYPDRFNGQQHSSVDRSTPPPPNKPTGKGLGSLDADARKAYDITLSGVKNRAGFDEKAFTKQWLSDYNDEG